IVAIEPVADHGSDGTGILALSIIGTASILLSHGTPELVLPRMRTVYGDSEALGTTPPLIAFSASPWRSPGDQSPSPSPHKPGSRLLVWVQEHRGPARKAPPQDRHGAVEPVALASPPEGTSHHRVVATGTRRHRDFSNCEMRSEHSRTGQEDLDGSEARNSYQCSA